MINEWGNYKIFFYHVFIYFVIRPKILARYGSNMSNRSAVLFFLYFTQHYTI